MTSSSKPYRIVISGLVLFAFSLALSKSASNILIALIYLASIYFAVRYTVFRTGIKQTVRQPMLLPFVLILSVAVIGLLFSEYLPGGIGIVNKLGGMLMVYLMYSVLLDSIEEGAHSGSQAERMLVAFLIGVAALNVIAVLTYVGLVDHKKFVLPLAPLHMHHIWFSNLNAVAIYTAVSFLLFSPNRLPVRYRTFLIGFTVLAGICILLSLSRTAWLGIFCTTIILTAIVVKKKKIIIAVFSGMIAAVVLLYFFNEIVHTRLNQIVSDISLFITGHAETNIGERFLMWKAAFQMFRSNPIFGVGTGDYYLTMYRYMQSGEFPHYMTWFNQPHNMYLFALATNGLLGLAALLYVFYRGLRYSLTVLKQGGESRLLAFVALATIIHYMIAGMTDSFFNIQILRYTFGFVMGVCLRNSMRVKYDS